MPSYVVAGASRGLGLEFVKQLLDRGNIVIALARNPSGAKGLVAIKNKNLYIVKADITDVPSLKAAAEETAKITGGSLDVLINNAAYQDPQHSFHSILEFPNEDSLIESFNACWKTNVLGPILTTNAFLPLLRKGTLKKVLNLDTGVADAEMNLKADLAGQTAYCVSKAALEMVGVKYAIALKAEGFTFLSISPGLVNTAEAPRTPHVCGFYTSHGRLTSIIPLAPPEALPGIQKMVEAFLKVYPNWKGSPIEPPESVEKMLAILDKATPEDSGKFISHLGNKQWL